MNDALSRFDNVSIDLMCGLPGNLGQFESSLREAVELGVKHVSVYPLTIEDHTLFAHMVASGEIPEPDEDVEADMMKLACERPSHLRVSCATRSQTMRVGIREQA